MTNWNDAAREAWSQYEQGVRAALNATGADADADADEVVADLRAHIDEELAHLDLVTAEHVERWAARVGVPEAASAMSAGTAASAHERDGLRVSRSMRSMVRGGMTSAPASIAMGRSDRRDHGYQGIGLGFFLPATAMLLELVTRICSNNFFDPLPTLGHVLLFATIPISALVVVIARSTCNPTLLARIVPLHGIATGVAIAYAIAFLPLIPMSAIGSLFVFGLAGFAPYGGLLALLRQRRAIDARVAQPMRLSRGIALGLLLLCLVELPTSATRIGLHLATSDSAATRSRGLWLLRTLGSRDELLRACNQRQRGATDLIGFTLALAQPLSPTVARDIYFRATGMPFNADAAGVFGSDRFPRFGSDDDAFDADQGGNVVGGRARDVQLHASALDGKFDAEAGTVYLEWTLVFRNQGRQQREARCLVRLPPGAAVSRATLWVNEEPREAVFAAASRARSAYESVVRARRDPLLVTSAGADHVLVQCFPVQPSATMKIRLGITAPVIAADAGGGALCLPCVVERNFAVADELVHHVWLEAAVPLRSSAPGMLAEAHPGRFALRGDLTDVDLLDPAAAVRIDAVPQVGDVAWCIDPSDEALRVVQRVEVDPSPPPSHVVVVVDGSSGMRDALPVIGAALDALSPAIDSTVLLAGDEVREIEANELRSYRARGGADNEVALQRAFDLAVATPGALILWIHGPQPVTRDGAMGLAQRFKRLWPGPRVLDLAVTFGRNRIAEEIAATAAFETVPRLGELGDDLRRLLQRWSLGEPGLRIERARLAADEPGEAASVGRQVSDHVARLWGLGEIERLRRTGADDDALALAIAYRLVTPISGAVVLETAAQYQRAGLTPPDDDMPVPTIPEPEVWALLLIAGVVVLGSLRRGR